MATRSGIPNIGPDGLTPTFDGPIPVIEPTDPRDRAPANYHADHGGDLCFDDDNDGVCDGCHASLDKCGACGGRGYHRRGCAESEEGDGGVRWPGSR